MLTTLRGYLAAQEAALRGGDRALRAGDADAVHPSRVAVRRLRSTLRTFKPLWPAPVRKPLDADLKGYAAALGEVRDLQVLRTVLADNVAAVDPDDPALARWLDDELAGQLASRWQRLELDLHAQSHHALLESVAGFLLVEPRTSTDLAKRVRKSERVVERKLAKAGDDVELLHAARKSAKRARYAVEAVGGSSDRAGRYEALQDLLGHHHDCTVAVDWLVASTPPAELVSPVAGLVRRLTEVAEETRLQAISSSSR